MNHIIVNRDRMSDDKRSVTVTGAEAHHLIHVLRIREDEEFSVSIADEMDMAQYRYGVVEIRDDAVIGELRFIKEEDVELPSSIVLFQGLPKSDKMELIVQKAVELGAASIIPMKTKRSVVRLDEARAAKKVYRWQEIASAAAAQSRRSILPTVENIMTVAEAATYASHLDVVLLTYELALEDDPDALRRTGELLRSIKPGQTVGIIIGPEGGWAPEEVEMLRNAGAQTISLGHRILRTETAGMTVLSWLILQLEII